MKNMLNGFLHSQNDCRIQFFDPGKSMQIDKAQPKQMASVASSARVRSGSSGATNSGSHSSIASSSRPSITKGCIFSSDYFNVNHSINCYKVYCLSN